MKGRWRTASDATVLALGLAMQRDYGVHQAIHVARQYAKESFKVRRLEHATNWMAVAKRIAVRNLVKRPYRNFALETP